MARLHKLIQCTVTSRLLRYVLRREMMAQFRKKRRVGTRIFWTLIAFMCLVFLTGGGARGDIQSLILLRPVAVICCGVALWSLRAAEVRAHRFLFGMATAIVVLVVCHLVPLPPFIWTTLPGREILEEIDRTAGLGAVWRPLSMVPSAAWNALYSLFVPMAVLFLGVQLSLEERFKLLPAVVALGLFSGVLGLLQSISDPHGPLYFYSVTNNGSAVGLFANRNHQAILLATLFPMLAVYACTGVRTEEQAKVRGYIAIAAGVVLVPLLLVTGSRAGLIGGLIGLLSVPLLYRRSSFLVPKKRSGKTLDLRWLLGAFAVLCLGALTLIVSRAEALQRIFLPDQTEDFRFLAWPHIWEMAGKYFPFGAGAGSFVEIFQIHEPNELLQPTYFNHAHNDWLEVYLTLGLPGLVLIAIVLWVFLRAALTAFKDDRGKDKDALFARLGAVILAILALGSVGDYPIRTPALASLFVLATLWLAPGRRIESKSTGTD
jgi:O-antigen ligase